MCILYTQVRGEYMDVIYKNSKGIMNHILCNDHKPNPAFINEFQTCRYTLKLNSIEIIESYFESLILDDDALFVLFHIEIRNNTNEIIDVYSEDFTLTCNNKYTIYPEENYEFEFQLKNEFYLKPWDIYKGYLIFITEKNIKKLDFFYTEIYDEDDFKEYHLRYKIENSV